MSGLIPKNKTEFGAQPLEDMSYETYREAAEANIRAKHNASSIYLNRLLIWGFGLAITAAAITTCNKVQGMRNDLQNGLKIEVVPQIGRDNEDDQDSYEQQSEDPQMMRNWPLESSPQDTIPKLTI